MAKLRSYTFNAGTRLVEIIEEVLLTSMYGRELAKQLADDIEDPLGPAKWYEMQVKCVYYTSKYRNSKN